MTAEDCCLLWVCTAVGVFYIGKWTLGLLCGLLTCLRVALGSRLWKRNLVAEYGGKWAVVTGSTDGIGKEYARQLAQRGMNIILISRTPEKLKKVEEEIKKEFGVETHTIAADFNNGRQIYDGIANGLAGKDIGILVNNVGFYGPKLRRFNEVGEDDIWRYLHVNAASVVAMTNIVLPQMLARKQGAIINISSMAAVLPFPLASIYSASKTFVTYFSQALEFEYRDSGITVQTVQPSVVVTNMSAISKYCRNPDAFMTPSAATYVSSALRSLGLVKVTAGTWDHYLQTFILERLNHELVGRVANKYGELFTKDTDSSEDPKKTN